MKIVCDTTSTEFIKASVNEKIMFDATSLNKISGVFEVGIEGDGILIAGYDLQGEKLTLVRVLMEHGEMPSSKGDSCNCKCASEILTQAGVAAKDNIQGCSWALDDNNTLGVLTVPGFYQIQRKPTPGIISNGTVTIRSISKEAVANIPSNLMFGNK